MAYFVQFINVFQEVHRHLIFAHYTYYMLYSIVVPGRLYAAWEDCISVDGICVFIYIDLILKERMARRKDGKIHDTI